ncbi:MAG TPA: hypothetical protein VGQ36_08765 [Thermoanaerobaculia bacterium]|jgi:hypothetical protein|nr:hypothetical protein [Thermoanaerobaculia bacterium]
MAIYPEDAQKMTEEELRKEIATCGAGSEAFNALVPELLGRYLLRIESAVDRLAASSNRLERLTWALVILTVVLAILAAPPAFEIVTTALSR